MKFEVTEIINFDYDKEIDRIARAYDDPLKSLLLEIVEAFKHAEYKKAEMLYKNLPYDNMEEFYAQDCCNGNMISICYKFNYWRNIKRIK